LISANTTRIVEADYRGRQVHPLIHSKMKVTSMVTRYSSILPFFTLAFSSITCRPVIPRNVLFARVRPSWIAASKLVGEAAVIFDTLATAISASLKDWPPDARIAFGLVEQGAESDVATD
jgi:hypothetical protein